MDKFVPNCYSDEAWQLNYECSTHHRLLMNTETWKLPPALALELWKNVVPSDSVDLFALRPVHSFAQKQETALGLLMLDMIAVKQRLALNKESTWMLEGISSTFNVMLTWIDRLPATLLVKCKAQTAPKACAASDDHNNRESDENVNQIFAIHFSKF